MALLWPTHLITPLPIGGAARLQATPGGAVDGLRAILAPTVATDANILPVDGLPIDLSLVAGRWDASIWGAQGARKCSWFTLVGAVWTAGPVDDIALPFSMVARFPVPLDWIVDRMRDYALAVPPLASKPFAVSRSYPRNVAAWPMASVQLDDISPDARVLGDLLELGVHGSIYTTVYSITCWCATPEDRRVITPWLAGAMEALQLCSKFHPDLIEPSISLSEAEDFNTLDVPAFLSTGRLTAKVISDLTTPSNRTYGRVTVP